MLHVALRHPQYESRGFPARGRPEVKSWGRWNWSFHSALYAPANRPVMLSFLKTLNINCDRHTRLHLVFTRALHRVGQAHRELLRVCRTRDPEQASAAL
ncbi:MAG: hypothetical protein DMG39_12505 [Acidobacteria bacterium]|nr:MAG: hypothetical protein DMG39_12505 [Acidobacteriota bacterium]